MAHVVVVGGGISGLAAAHRLVRAGQDVTLLEASGQLGGLGTFFEREGRTVERFYHCVMPTDEHLLPLLDDLGLRDTVRWRPTTMGMVEAGQRYPFNTALDLLRFTPLTLVQRIRFGVVSLLLRFLGRGRDLDHLRIEDWLRRLYGDVIWERMFSPMMGSKFGPAFGDVPALYLWQRLGREKNVATRGYPSGGYSSIIAGLRASIEDAGGTIRTAAPVASLDARADGVTVELDSGEQVDADWAISTLPLPTLRAVATPALAPALPTVQLAYQGVVNVLFFLRRPLDGHYWAPVLHSDTEFDGVIEMSTLNGTHDGHHLAYAMHYCDRGGDLYLTPDEEIARRWTAQLLATYPDRVDIGDVAEVRVFKAPFVEPVYPLGYADAKPAAEVPGTRLMLATTAQIYPEVTSWNSSTGLSNRVVDDLLARIGAPVPAVITLA
ncbi:MAG: FAD-dependent oxidoreductase [Pseudonocardia sp.]|nr:FAD-dependent oxidoreductase [Pseudonocardia sp.]